MKRVVKNAVIGKEKGTVVILCGVIVSFLFIIGGCDKLRRIEIIGGVTWQIYLDAPLHYIFEISV